jgi:hypothetical protein
VFSNFLHITDYHHHNEHNQGLGLKTCSFKAQGVLGLSIFILVFPYPAIPEVGTGKTALVGGFYPFIPGGLTIYFDTILNLLLFYYVKLYQKKWLQTTWNDY